jgi:hypothetical protein
MLVLEGEESEYIKYRITRVNPKLKGDNVDIV